MEKKFRVRDLRKKTQFIVDDAYLNGYGKIFGPSGTAVYLSLCRRANKAQFCWPSEKTIAEDHNITDRTARTHIKRLVEARIIRIERERSESGKWRHNVYYLLDKSEWKAPEEITSSGYRRKLETRPEENNDITQRKQIPPKEPHANETHRNDAHISSFTFENFWNEYPRKIAKKKALQAWKRINPSTELAEKIINAVRSYKQTNQWKRDKGQYIPYPLTFLNQERWNDELEMKEPSKYDELEIIKD